MARDKSNLTKQSGNAQRFSIIAIALTLVGILVCAALLYWQVVLNSNAKHTELTNQRTTAALASLINSRIDALQKQVRQLAGTTDVIDALLSDDPSLRLIVSDRITALTPHARRVDIIASGDAKVDLNAATPLTFAALDLIRRAESTEIVGPEASVNQKDIVFAAAPITARDGVIGVFFIALDEAYFTRLLTDLGAEGQIQIEQNFENNIPNIVISVGSTEGGDESQIIREALNVKTWTLLFNPKSQPAVFSSGSLITPLLVALALALGGIGLAFSRLTAALQSDAQQLSDYGGKLLRGRRPSLDRYTLTQFEKVATNLANAKDQIDEAPEAPLDFASADKTSARSSKSAGAAALASQTDEADDLLDEDSFLDIEEDIVEQDSDNAAKAEKNADLQANENFGIGVSEGASPIDLGLKIERSIFRAYDIRGIVEQQLTTDVVYWIGRAFATQASSQHQNAVIVGCDGRLSSPAIKEALARGLVEGGMDVIDIGEVPTPLLYFATHTLSTNTGIMITGSHNPPEYNGLKMMIAGETLADTAIERLYTRIVENELDEDAEDGTLSSVGIDNDYLDRILDDVALARNLKVVVDCGNGVAGASAPRLIEQLGCEVIPLYCEVDGTFPNHHPDPADPDNLQDLITVVKAENADLGLAFDGDGDRLGVVTNTGNIVYPDKLLMLFARDVVSRNPGTDIVYDVKCSRHLNTLISENGGRPIMWKTGHSHLKAKIKETGALLGGEFSGHIAFVERWYGFDDALYSAARLLEIIGSQSSSAEEVFAEFPTTESTPEIKIDTTDSAKFDIIEKLASEGDFGEGTTTNIDGVRVDYEDGWGLIRASNTSPTLTLRFEADDSQALRRVQQLFRQQLAKIDSKLTF